MENFSAALLVSTGSFSSYLGLMDAPSRCCEAAWALEFNARIQYMFIVGWANYISYFVLIHYVFALKAPKHSHDSMILGDDWR